MVHVCSEGVVVQALGTKGEELSVLSNVDVEVGESHVRYWDRFNLAGNGGGC